MAGVPDNAFSKKRGHVPQLELPKHRFELACGAVLLVSPRPGAPVASMRVHIRGGASLDPDGQAGLAHLTGSLLDQGTKTHDEQAIAALLEPAGGEFSGDVNGFSLTIAGAEWKLMLEFASELLTTPTYPKQAVDRQKRRLLSRLLVERDDARMQGGKRYRKLVYGNHWLGRPAYGTYESVEGIEAKHLRSFHKQYWNASRCLIAVCGDVDPVQVKRLLDRRLADFKRGKPHQPIVTKLPPRAPRYDAFKASRQQLHVYLGHLGIRRNDPDYAALAVMDHILGTGPGFTNRISRRLRDELGLAYTVSADIHSSAGVHPGTFTAYIGTSPEHLETAVAGFLREIRLIQSKAVTQGELETAKNYLLGSFALGFERSARRANYLIASEVYGFPEDNLKRLPEQFAAVTAADIKRVANAHLFPDACCLAVSGPTTKSELKKVLTKAMKG